MARCTVDPSCIESLPFTEEFVCGICANILQRPMSGCKNGHTFCEECYGKWLRVNSSCPNCRTHVSSKTLQLNLPLANMIAKLPTKCNNNSIGCTWTGEVKDLKQHTASCPFQCEVMCTLCKTSLLLPHLQQHITDKHPDEDPLQVHAKIMLEQQLEITKQNTKMRDVYMSGFDIIFQAVIWTSTSELSSGVVGMLIQNTRTLIDDPYIVLASCRILACVLYNTEHSGTLCRKIIFENDGIRLLYDCLEKYIDNHGIVLSVTTCLSNISVAMLRGDDKILVERKGVNLLVTCMKNFAGSPKTETMICRAIRNHLQHEQVGCALVHSDGLQIILECNARNAYNMQLLTETWYALGNVTMTYHMSKQIIFDHGAVDRAQESLVHYLPPNEPMESTRTQGISDSVMWFLSKMICECRKPNCKIKEVNSRVAQKLLMEKVLHAMEKHPKSHKVQTRGAILIENMLHSVEWSEATANQYEDVLNESKLALEVLLSVLPSPPRPSFMSVRDMINQIDKILLKTWTPVKRRKVIQKSSS